MSTQPTDGVNRPADERNGVSRPRVVTIEMLARANGILVTLHQYERACGRQGATNTVPIPGLPHERATAPPTNLPPEEYVQLTEELMESLGLR